MYENYGAVIPAFEAHQQISEVIRGATRYVIPGNIVVVDDGSTDETAGIAEREGVHVIRHLTNRGKGASLRTGFDWVAARPGITAAFTLDADGQHDPDEMPSFIEAFERDGPDLLIGNRMGGARSMPRIRLWTNRVTSAVISRRLGCRVEDSQCGYRLIRTSLLRRIVLSTSHFETESEILLRAAQQGAVIRSTPIETIYAGEKSMIRPFRDTVRFFILVIRSYFW